MEQNSLISLKKKSTSCGWTDLIKVRIDVEIENKSFTSLKWPAVLSLESSVCTNKRKSVHQTEMVLILNLFMLY